MKKKFDFDSIPLGTVLSRAQMKLVTGGATAASCTYCYRGGGICGYGPTHSGCYCVFNQTTDFCQ